jgi:hypothetical protein
LQKSTNLKILTSCTSRHYHLALCQDSSKAVEKCRKVVEMWTASQCHTIMYSAQYWSRQYLWLYHSLLHSMTLWIMFYDLSEFNVAVYNIYHLWPLLLELIAPVCASMFFSPNGCLAPLWTPRMVVLLHCELPVWSSCEIPNKIQTKDVHRIHIFVLI